jgi:hypothetical protein
VVVELERLDEPDFLDLPWDRGFALSHNITNQHGITPDALKTQKRATTRM